MWAWCRMTATHRHHRKRRSQGGDDSPTNILLLPQEVHAWVHDNPDKAYELGWLVKSYDDPKEISVQIPEELVKIAKRREKRQKEEARQRAVVSIRVPKDEREDGAKILDELIDQCRFKLTPVLGLKENCPAYYVLVPVLSDWLTNTPTTKEEE